MHNRSWCDILADKGIPKPQKLIDIIKAATELTKKGNPIDMSAIHGHHIVMKLGGEEAGDAARQILKDYDIPLLGIKEEFEAATDISNMAYAINGWQGIHSPKYAAAVRDKLQDAVSLGGSHAAIKSRVQDALKEMRDTLHRGEIFWEYP